VFLLTQTSEAFPDAVKLYTQGTIPATGSLEANPTLHHNKPRTMIDRNFFIISELLKSFS